MAFGRKSSGAMRFRVCDAEVRLDRSQRSEELPVALQQESRAVRPTKSPRRDWGRRPFLGHRTPTTVHDLYLPMVWRLFSQGMWLLGWQLSRGTTSQSCQAER